MAAVLHRGLLAVMGTRLSLSAEGSLRRIQRSDYSAASGSAVTQPQPQTVACYTFAANTRSTDKYVVHARIKAIGN